LIALAYASCQLPKVRKNSRPVVALVVGLCIATSLPTRAQEAASNASAAAQAPVARPVPAAEVPLVWSPWPLFDPYLDVHERGLMLEWTRWRSKTREQNGGSLAYGEQVSTVVHHLAVTGRRKFIAASVLEGPAYALGLGEHDFLGGLDFGFLSLSAGAGVLPLAADLDRSKFSLAVLSPAALAVLSIRIGSLRIDATLSASYYFRVLGRGPLTTQALALSFWIESPRPMFIGRHPVTVEPR